MKLIMESWRNFTNEARGKAGIIDTERGKEEVKITYESGDWFIYKTGKGSKVYYMLTHKPSGKLIPSSSNSSLSSGVVVP